MKTTILISLSWLMCSAAWAVESPPPLFLEQGDPNLSAPMQSFVQHVSTRADTIRSRVATMNWAGLSGDVLTLNPFPDVLLTADKTDIGFSGSRYSCWQGTLRNGKGTVALVMNGDRISGTISSVDGIFDLCPMEGGSCAIIEREPSSIPECGTGQAAMSQRVSVPIPDEGDVLPGSSPLADGDQGDTPTANRIRVLVAYTSSSQTKTQTDYNRTMQEHIDLAIVESNQGYANSAVTMRMQLACLYETGATETTAIENDVDDFQGSGDGFADEVHTLRNEYDADMCCLIVDGRDTDWCGWAYGFDYTSAANMFQATSYDCATGRFTFAHEFGHTQGCRHNSDSTLTPFAYGHGFRNGSNWRTVMGLSNNTGATRLNYWSNPAINSPVWPLTAMGTAINGGNFANDCETALDVGDGTVVNHQTTPTSSSALNGNVVNNDEVADKIVTTSLTVGTFTANSGSRIRFVSGDKITLQSGFHARAGSEVNVKLGNPLTN